MMSMEESRFNSTAGLMPLESGFEAPLIALRGLQVHFDLGGGNIWKKLVAGDAPERVVKAVDGVSIASYAGERWALVGESGCVTTMLGRAVLRLTERTAGQWL